VRFLPCEKKKSKAYIIINGKDGAQKKIIDTPIVKHPRATHGLKRSPFSENTNKEM
jgi:ribulose bisphosphate carboxylase small subunit